MKIVDSDKSGFRVTPLRAFVAALLIAAVAWAAETAIDPANRLVKGNLTVNGNTVLTGTTTHTGATSQTGAATFGGVVSAPAFDGGSITARLASGFAGVTTMVALDAGLQSKVGGVQIGAIITQDGGLASHVCQVGYGAMTANALAVTFTRAFSSVPQCTCTHVDTTNTNTCTILAAGVPTTTAVTFAVASGGTDLVHWMCCGDI